MNISITILVVTAIMIVVLGVFAVTKLKRQAEIRRKYPGYPKDYWMNQGIAVGIAIGAGIGAGVGNIAVGVGVGVAIGVAVGSSLEKQHEDEIRPITEEEKELRKQARIFAAITLLVGIVVFAAIYLIAR